MSEHGPSSETRLAPPVTNDLGPFERRLSALIVAAGLAALGALWLSRGRQGLPVAAVVAFTALYATGKLVSAALGLARHWPAWPAVLAEGLAVLVVAGIVWTGVHDPVWLFACVIPLLAASAWRARLARRHAEDA